MLNFYSFRRGGQGGQTGQATQGRSLGLLGISIFSKPVCCLSEYTAAMLLVIKHWLSAVFSSTGKAMGVCLILFSLLLIVGCSSGGDGDSSSGGNEPGNTTNMDGDGDISGGGNGTGNMTSMDGDGGPSDGGNGTGNTTSMDGDGGPSDGGNGTSNMINMGGDGGTTIPSQVQWSIIPITEGLRIEWRNLAVFDPTPTSIYLNLTSTSLPQGREIRISIDDANDNSYEIHNLTDGQTYRLAEVRVEFADDVAPQVIPITWLEQTDPLSNNIIVVGNDHDGDGLVDVLDGDDDNDGIDDEADGAPLDLCPRGILGWVSDERNDYDGDGCRDEDEDRDDDNDQLLDGDELADCERNPDCDGDEVLDGWELRVCINKPNCDDDSYRDDVDIDDDGDGLIEIWNAARLDAVRHQLDGSGLRLISGGIVNTTGCPMDGCRGYELTNNISLTDYITTTYGDMGWLPIGRSSGILFQILPDGCAENGRSDFSAIFDGNGFVISGLSINRQTQRCMGLFSSIAGQGEVHRLGIKADNIKGASGVGGLAAHSKGIINSSYVMATSLTGSFAIGGLVGVSGSARIYASHAIITSITGDTGVGGLIGLENGVYIDSSWAIIKSLTGGRNVGGLVGGQTSETTVTTTAIHASYAIVDSLTGNTRNAGGLMGRFFSKGSITSSYAIVDRIHGGRNTGGLVGFASNKGGLMGSLISGFDITSSYAILNSLTTGSTPDKDEAAGGLVGQAYNGKLISSFVVAGSLRGGDHVGGLIGNSTLFSINSSYGVFGSVTSDSNAATGTLIGHSVATTVGNSYWNSDTTDLMAGAIGMAKSSDELTTPIDYGGIYTNWDDSVDRGAGKMNNITVYCDRNLNGEIEATEQTNDNKIWDFGTSITYPAIRCTPDSLDDQRAWWSLNATGKPELDRVLLNDWLDGDPPL